MGENIPGATSGMPASAITLPEAQDRQALWYYPEDKGPYGVMDMAGNAWELVRRLDDESSMDVLKRRATRRIPIYRRKNSVLCAAVHGYL